MEGHVSAGTQSPEQSRQSDLGVGRDRSGERQGWRGGEGDLCYLQSFGHMTSILNVFGLYSLTFSRIVCLPDHSLPGKDTSRDKAGSVVKEKWSRSPRGPESLAF